MQNESIGVEVVEACKALLTPHETAHFARFIFDEHRREYLVTRGLCRAVLATYLYRSPAELVFERTEFGMPFLTTPHCDLAFNLTNTTALVACAVTRGRRVGVDAEPLDRADQVLELAESVFTPLERAAIERLAMLSRGRRAVELWTVKEAYVKARGLGLSLRVDLVETRFPGEDGFRGDRRVLEFRAPACDHDRWALTTSDIDGHLVSVCTELLDVSEEVVEVAVRRADIGALLSRVPAAARKGLER